MEQRTIEELEACRTALHCGQITDATETVTFYQTAIDAIDELIALRRAASESQES